MLDKTEAYIDTNVAVAHTPHSRKPEDAMWNRNKSVLKMGTILEETLSCEDPVTDPDMTKSTERHENRGKDSVQGITNTSHPEEDSITYTSIVDTYDSDHVWRTSLDAEGTNLQDALERGALVAKI